MAFYIQFSDDDPVTALIKAQEGFSEKSYKDATGRSIGYGHFIRPGEEHLNQAELSEEEASELLAADIKAHQDPWSKNLKASLNQQQMAALTSFAYNTGAYGSIQQVVQRINAGDMEGATAIMAQFTKAKEGPNGELVTLKALQDRRAFEIKLLRGERVDDIVEAWDARSETKSSSILDGLIGKDSLVGKLAHSLFDFKGLTKPFRFTRPPNRTVTGMSSSNTDEWVLSQLKDLNTRLRAVDPFDIDEAAWAARVMQEGKGWPAH